MDEETNKDEVYIVKKRSMGSNDTYQSIAVEEKAALGSCSDLTKVYKRRLCVLVLILLTIAVGAIIGNVVDTKKNESPTLGNNSATFEKIGRGAIPIDSTSAQVYTSIKYSIPVNTRGTTRGTARDLASVTGGGMVSAKGVVHARGMVPVTSPVIAPVTASVNVPTTAPTTAPATISSTSAPMVTSSAAPVPTVPSMVPSFAEMIAPTAISASNLLDFLSTLSNASAFEDKSTPQYQAYQFIASAVALNNNVTGKQLTEHYAAAVVHYSLGYLMPLSSWELCLWPTLVCNETTRMVSEINMARLSLNGSLPTELGLLSSVTKIDLGENQVIGKIPDDLYHLTDLQFLYMESNQLTGSLSQLIDNTRALEVISLGNNQLSGPLPSKLKSKTEIRPLRFLNLYNNQFTGTIPSALRLRNLYYADLSHNKLSGPLPLDFAITSVKLDHLYLNHNEFTGTVPSEYSTIGNGHIISLTLNNNQFTGDPPTQFGTENYSLLTYEIQNNGFTGTISNEFCHLFVFLDGELVELGADCDICTCNLGPCDVCY